MSLSEFSSNIVRRECHGALSRIPGFQEESTNEYFVVAHGLQSEIAAYGFMLLFIKSLFWLSRLYFPYMTYVVQSWTVPNVGNQPLT